MKKRYLLSLLSLSVACACQARADIYPDPIGPSQSDFGGVGLLQVPSARMAQDGEFSVNYRYNDQYLFYSSSMQLFPWLEATIRYTDVKTREYSADSSFSGSQTYKDKAFDLKLRLWEEDYWLPQVSVGSRDLGGTGLFDSEYLVASKAWGPFDFTLGFGWGYLGNSGTVKNPFCSIGHKYCYRANGGGTAGSLSASEMFKGPTAFFGGMEYQTPWQPLRLKVEYEGNDYQDDFAGKLKQNSKVNVGAIYRLTDWADVNVSYERGNTLMAGFTLRTNFNDLHQNQIDSIKPSYNPQPQERFLDPTVTAEQLNQLKYNAGLDAPNVQVDGSTLYVTGEQAKYRNTQLGVDRANVIMANHLPAGIDTLRVTQTRSNMPQVTTQTDVASLQRQLAGYPLGKEETLQQQRVNPIAPGHVEQGFHISDERLDYDLSPVLDQSVGGPESFYLYQVGVMANASFWLTDHLLLDGSLFGNLSNNYDKFSYDGAPKDSTLPRVRTHIRDYVENNVYVSNLQINYMHELGNGFYGQLYGGYLETMFGGVGGEVLYRPLDVSWAVGVDANYVRQRDWNNMMQFTDYTAKVGNITGYWQPWFMRNVLVKASVGQYLAEDKGVTLDVSKRFDSGIIVGAYATKTNVSAQEYGEGDFTKGFYISVPLDVFSVTPIRDRAQINWTPLTRDGGQMLGRKYPLYNMTSDRDASYR
ncbi:YjbH domain-containing protein [Erwinia pyrifoliae]|uniref:YjbH domain-containing protein n=1 Tax=Erwinia pyrifoliae TaxID=79967 RepID=A0ABY5X7G2_ERWPY|nr:YjbH domain-containing protein [Erwinia pyrifoliae]AUX71355.1 YjbH domain-containing protein [Erwinia pyrifoliae]MCA8874923.1 YjbH domain-containing protein [Erwinia pyrifoliae]MCT2385160.1 YjbH domain-containing protein [Erwinia pyrifoliae]MCU8585616.1 YjbH domain-containing protein [Erwinia pyrifoliae]UWS29028.1 YjbH domain-containing protein [Erwinia pyrifoliae]